MIDAIQYARENNIPFLGLCLGMQLAIVEFVRNVVGFNDAHSIELNSNTTHPVIALMPDQNGVEDIGGTLRLGTYECPSVRFLFLWSLIAGVGDFWRMSGFPLHC